MDKNKKVSIGVDNNVKSGRRIQSNRGYKPISRLVDLKKINTIKNYFI